MSNEVSAAVDALGGLSVESAGLAPDGATLLVGGPSLSFWALTSWRLIHSGKIAASNDVDGDLEGLLRRRVARRIVAQSSITGVDPAFDFGGGTWLEIFSDAWLEPWMLSVGNIRGAIGNPSDEELFERATVGTPSMLDVPWEITDVRREGWGGTTLIVAGKGHEVVLRSSWRVLSGTSAVELSGVAPGKFPPVSLIGRRVIGSRSQGSVLDADCTLLLEGGFAIEQFSTMHPGWA